MQSEGLKLNQRITLIVFELMAVFFGLKAFYSRMKSIWTIQPLLKGHSQLWDRADLDTIFLTLKKVHAKQESKFCLIFNRLLKNLFLNVVLLML